VRGAHDGQESRRPHGEGDRALPTRPTPDLLLIEADLPFGFLTALFDGPAAPDNLDRGREGRRLRGIHDGRGARGGVAETPTDQEPPPPVGLARRSQGEPAPVRPSGACGPVTSPHATPVLLLQHRQERFALPLAASTPDLCFPRHREDRRLGALFPPLPPRALIAIPPGPGPPGGRHGRVTCPRQPLLGAVRLRGNGPLRRHPCTDPACRIIRPRLGQRAFAIQHSMALRTCLGYKAPHWAMRNTAGGPTLWSGHAGRTLAFVEQPCLIPHEHRVGIAHRLDHRGVSGLAHRLSIPPGTPQHMLEAIRCRLPIRFGDLPPIFPLDGAPQAPQRGPHPTTSGAAGQVGHETAFHFGQP